MKWRDPCQALQSARKMADKRHLHHIPGSNPSFCHSQYFSIQRSVHSFLHEFSCIQAWYGTWAGAGHPVHQPNQRPLLFRLPKETRTFFELKIFAKKCRVLVYSISGGDLISQAFSLLCYSRSMYHSWTFPIAHPNIFYLPCKRICNANPYLSDHCCYISTRIAGDSEICESRSILGCQPSCKCLPDLRIIKIFVPFRFVLKRLLADEVMGTVENSTTRQSYHYWTH